MTSSRSRGGRSFHLAFIGAVRRRLVGQAKGRTVVNDGTFQPEIGFWFHKDPDRTLARACLDVGAGSPSFPVPAHRSACLAARTTRPSRTLPDAHEQGLRRPMRWWRRRGCRRSNRGECWMNRIVEMGARLRAHRFLAVSVHAGRQVLPVAKAPNAAPWRSF